MGQAEAYSFAKSKLRVVIDEIDDRREVVYKDINSSNVGALDEYIELGRQKQTLLDALEDELEQMLSISMDALTSLLSLLPEHSREATSLALGAIETVSELHKPEKG